MTAMLMSLQALFMGPSLLYMMLGVILGLIFGAVPGLTATLAVVVLVPLTYSLDPTTGIAMLIGTYVGGVSGGLVSAIMLNMPGTPASVATTFEGYPLAQQGKAGKALGTAVISSFVGTFLGWVCLVFLSPLLGKVALAFGPFEYTAALLFGFTAVVTLAGDSVFKGIVSAMLGLTLCLIGRDINSGAARATFDIDALSNGFAFIPALIGLLVISEVFSQIKTIGERYILPKQKLDHILMTAQEFKESITNFIRSSLIGVGIGILPGIGGSFANFVCYDQAKKASKNPESFGKGNLQGIVASETGNNATIGGALIPLVALGIPGDTVTAALIGGLMIKGITPGPMFIKEYPEVFYTILNSLLLSGLFMMLFMLLIGIRVFPVVLRLQKHYLLPLVLIMSLAGAYNVNFSVNDIWTTVAMGMLGFILDRMRYPKTPIVITLLLGRGFESQLRRAMAFSGGSILPLFTRPYALLFILLSLMTLIPLIFRAYRKSKSIKVDTQGY